MCLFSQTVELVSDTHIFARVERDRQFLAYEMKVSTPKETAMILPLPVREGSGEDALRFIDLSAYPEFFDDLDTLFYHPQAAIASLEAGDFLAAPLLEVHRVGEFEASYVPSLDDFSRLDPRFNLPPKTWAALPRVSDFGFAVFQLRAGGARPIHPMAFSFPTRWADTAFFPTVHVHDGEAHEQAHFDHKLYLQLNEEAVVAPDDHDAMGWMQEDFVTSLPSLESWQLSRRAPHSRVSIEKTGGLMTADGACLSVMMLGNYRNEDVTVGLGPLPRELEDERAKAGAPRKRSV